MKSFTVEITEERAIEICEAWTSVVSDGGGGDISFLVPDILATFPHLEDRFPHLFGDWP